VHDIGCYDVVGGFYIEHTEVRKEHHKMSWWLELELGLMDNVHAFMIEPVDVGFWS